MEKMLNNAKRYPKHSAIDFGTHRITYEELAKNSENWAK
jgi:hypothetical protein